MLGTRSGEPLEEIAMIMIVYPHQGVDRTQFGMSRTEVAGSIGAPVRRLRRGEYDLSDLDFFDTLGIKVNYDANERCNAIEFNRGFGTDLEYDGYHLFEHPAREVRVWALARDPQLDPEDGFDSRALGLGMWADWIDEPDLEPEMLLDPGMSFIIFRPGYYEEEQARMVAAGLVSGAADGPPSTNNVTMSRNSEKAAEEAQRAVASRIRVNCAALR
jgi:hypothetical protein